MREERVESSPVFLAAISLGVAVACLYSCIDLLIVPEHRLIYHMMGSAAVYFVPVFAYVMLIGAVLFAALTATIHYPRVQRLLLSLLVWLTPLVILRNLMELHGKTLGHAALLLLVSFGLALYVGCSRSELGRRSFAGSWRVGRGALWVLGFVGAMTLMQLAWFGLEARHLNDLPPMKLVPTGAHDGPRGRVIWIVLDELSYDQVYGRRFPGLALPNFDRLRSEATVFSQVVPAGIQTQFVLPSLMSGVPAKEIVSSADGKTLTMKTDRGPVRFDPGETVFGDADRMGYRSAVVGWYNPYCRILPRVLSSCTWISHVAVGGMFPGTTMRANLAYPVQRAIGAVLGLFGRRQGMSKDALNEAHDHVQDVIDLERASDAVLSNAQLNFVLLHLPLPHPLGIFNRRTGQFTFDDSTSYLDNLSLADDCIGHLRNVLEAEDAWNDATVVVMGDHSWRTRMEWAGKPGWTAEDAAASHGGQFDPRPGYIVKLPRQHSPAEISTPFAALDTRKLLQALLAHSITDSEQLKHWVTGASAR